MTVHNHREIQHSTVCKILYHNGQNMCSWVFTSVIVSPSPAPTSQTLCSLLASLVDVRKLSPAEWCSTAVERRQNASVCAEAFVSWRGNDGQLQYRRCRHDGERCLQDTKHVVCSSLPPLLPALTPVLLPLLPPVLEEPPPQPITPSSPPPAPQAQCSMLALLIDLRALSPPEWCFTAEERRQNATVCKGAFVSWRGNDRQLFYAPCRQS